jgi:hypothetical protein
VQTTRNFLIESDGPKHERLLDGRTIAKSTLMDLEIRGATLEWDAAA